MAASASDAHEYPIYNARFRLIVPLLDADGDPISPSSPDTELSQDLGTFADATNEATEIATSSGIVYIDLVAGELDTKSTTVRVQSTGAKTTVAVLNPRRLPVLRTGTAQAGAASTITLDSGASAVDDYYNGCWVNITNNSPANAQGQARKITDYVGSTKVATVEGTYGTNPSSASTFEILLPAELGVVQWAGAAVTDPNTAGAPRVDLDLIEGSNVSTSTAQLGVNTVQAGGTAWGSGAITAASIASDAITAAKIADGAIDAATLASGTITAAKFAAGAMDATVIADAAIDAATFAAGAINAAAIAADAIGASELAADAVAEIADAVWDEDATAHQTQGTFGQAIGDPGADTDTIFALVNTINADTDDIQSRLPAALVSGRIDASVGAVAANAITAASIAADAITAAKIADGAIDAATFAAGAIDAAAIAADAIGSSELAASAVTEIQAGLSTLTAAQVNAEVVDALNVDTYAEPGQETPAATTTLVKKIGYLYKLLRNKVTQDATTLSVYADDGTTVDQKATVSDDGTTFTRGEISTGP